jgi:hypothetical protein
MTLPGSVENAICHGLRFMLANQTVDGYWTDWQLPPGTSRMWTTAYAGYRLSTVSEPLRNISQCRLSQAAAWLASAELSGGGWGYNEEVGPDADSTALAILFLKFHGMSVAGRSYDRLRGFQRGDGGFSTYTYEQSFGAWVSSHPDVTALAVPALLTLYGRHETFVTRAEGYAIAHITPDGLWDSYWWNTPLYATEANLCWLARINGPIPAAATRETLLRMCPGNVFETALIVLSLLHMNWLPEHPAIVRWTGALLDAQLPDGSWPSEPVLRLPARDCYQPWAAREPAPTFADPCRIFTSATVIAALSAAWDRAAQT